MITLNLDETGRVLSAARCAAAPPGAVQVGADALPGDNLRAYRYVDGAFVYDPLPEQEPALQRTQAERIAALEAQTQLLVDCLLEISGVLYA